MVMVWWELERAHYQKRISGEREEGRRGAGRGEEGASGPHFPHLLELTPVGLSPQ